MFSLTRWIWIFFALFACGTAPKGSNGLRISFHMQPATLDPCRAGDFVSSTLICMVYEGLTRCLPGGDVELALAEKVEVDGTRYRFSLRKAYWSDGQPITAYDFERSWKRILSEPGVCAYLFYPILNAERFAKGEAVEVGIRALDERVLEVELERPTPYFYSLTAFPSFMASPLKDGVYSGPFRIEKIVRNSEIKLVKNPTYWNKDQISLDTIHISILPDESTSLQMFERGELDWLGGPLSPLPPDASEKLKDQITYIPSASSLFCTFNTETFNPDLRKAFSYAIDRKEIAEREQIAAESVLPPPFSKQKFSLCNREMAREYLKKGGPVESLILYYKSGQMEKRVAQMLQKQWQEVLGIKVQLVQLDPKSLTQRLQSRDYQIALTSWIAQFDDPVSILDRFKDRTHLKNFPGWENEEYGRLLVEAATSNRRRELLEEAEALLVEEMPLTPIFHCRFPAICSSRIEEVGTTPCGGVLFERFVLAKKK